VRSPVLTTIATLGLLFAAGAAGAWSATGRWWPLSLSHDVAGGLPGLRVDGEAVAAGVSVRALVETRATALQGRRVRLVLKDGDAVRPVLEASLGQLGVHVDVDAVTSRALRLGREGDPLTRAHQADLARRGQLDVPLEPEVDPRAVVERLVPLKEDLDVPPVPARLDLDRHDVLPEKNGRALDADAAADRVARAALDASVVEIELPFVDVAPRVTRASLARIDIATVVASFKTYFSRYGDQGPRARNIEVAASHVDGLVLEPGQLVSFNDVVGPRTEDNGFKTAFEIVKGEYKEGTGGGTCQVASTLHAIAFYGGLDIVQRLPHSRPSGYIPSGLDATVVYPVVDLKVRNPFTFPVVVHATVGANILQMELLGADKPIEVTFGKQVLSTTPYERKVEEDATVSKPKRKQKGIDGMELFRQRVLAYRDGTRKVENSRDVYPPTKEVWQVPPGFDASTLPGLGEDLPKPEDAKPQAAAQASAPQG
jgi:vancomycin resistance protein YoaR